jgi:hypothetical protein
MTTRLDDVSNCPRATECASCGGDEQLDRATGQTPVGVFCLTLCIDCAETERLPVLGWRTAVERAGEHAAHLGIDVDEMGRLMAAEELDQHHRQETFRC